jgi:hypothetical protein
MTIANIRKLERTENDLRFANVKVKAKVGLGSAGSAAKIQKIAQRAEKYCLVFGSPACAVQYNVEAVE